MAEAERPLPPAAAASAPAAEADRGTRTSGADLSPASAAVGEGHPPSRVSAADLTPASAAVGEGHPPSRVSAADLTPMMRQYREWKRRYPDYVLLFAWSFIEEVKKKRAEYLRSGGRFIVPLPEPTIISG